ncbi:MAG: hypothetical protein A2039_03380 [Candidatus Melainabacteria bacterium GWA2_34_9]|nr:MAG: hypothetical protein A2039_03380 [Candidatus Melainabacteria bacterium GWA2_34_9]
MFFSKIAEFLTKTKMGRVGTYFLSSVVGVNIFMSTFIFGGIEDKLIFYPIDKDFAQIRINVDKHVQDTYFYSRDGFKLNGWYIKAHANNPTIIYCHGQGENLSQWQNVAQFLANNGYGVFMIDYRGHGKSEGGPYEQGLYIDLESAINYLVDSEKVKRDNLVLWGRSMGGAVVADIASRNNFKAVILESTFTNLRDEAIHLTSTGILESKLGFWSSLSTKFVRYIPLITKFSTDKKICKITSPLLIGGSKNDETVPVAMSYKLESLNPKAKLFVSETGSHHESEWFFPEVKDFLESIQ